MCKTEIFESKVWTSTINNTKQRSVSIRTAILHWAWEQRSYSNTLLKEMWINFLFNQSWIVCSWLATETRGWVKSWPLLIRSRNKTFKCGAKGRQVTLKWSKLISFNLNDYNLIKARAGVWQAKSQKDERLPYPSPDTLVMGRDSKNNLTPTRRFASRIRSSALSASGQLVEHDSSALKAILWS